MEKCAYWWHVGNPEKTGRGELSESGTVMFRGVYAAPSVHSGLSIAVGTHEEDEGGGPGHE